MGHWIQVILLALGVGLIAGPLLALFILGMASAVEGMLDSWHERRETALREEFGHD